MKKTKHTSRPQSVKTHIVTTFLLLIACAAFPAEPCAQWATSGNNISNTNTGNVGIGTSTPAAKLDVNGIINVTGNITATGNISAKYQDKASL